MGYPIKFGKYLLLERINVGGMAEVFKAKAFGVQGFERLLAIKRILPNMSEDDEFINMFVDEARIAVQLSHSNVVQIYELGKVNESYYIAMEYVLGRDLRQIFDRFRQAERTFPVPAAAFVASKICDGLDYAHRKNAPTGEPIHLIHRDVSPQNILVSYDGAVKITDFGIAKAEDRASKTQAGVLKGKFGYMSPEQVRGMEIDRRSDIFALGILLYEMVTGERLFLGESDFSTLEKVRAAEVPPPSQYNPEIPEELERILLKALARDRDERYQWASELHDDLQRFLIVEHTIYNAKNLSELLREEYHEDIEQERRKAEEFMRIGAKEAQIEPEFATGVPQAFELAKELSAAPSLSGSTEDNDKTMIFEAFADFASAETMVAPSLSEMVQARAEGEALAAEFTQTGAGQESTPDGETNQPSLPSIEANGEAPKGRRPVGPLIVGITLMLCATIVAAVWYLTPSANVGSIFVTSAPITELDVYLDGELIGKSTPISRHDIPLGEHMISGKAKGFADKVYSFLLAPGQPAHIEFKMERQPPPEDKPVLDGMLQIASEPPRVAVRVNGVSRGFSPLTVRQLDRKKKVFLEFSKQGFTTKNLEVSFTPGEVSKLIEVELESADAFASDSVELGKGLLFIDSNPSKALVSIGGVHQGKTPLRLEGLEPGETVVVEVAKSGFKKFRRQVKLNSNNESVRLEATLERLSLKPGTQASGSVQGKSAETSSGSKKTKSKTSFRGDCSGSGARLSVMPVGVPDCSVTVGTQSLGVAPIFKKSAPVGKCKIVVRCSDGRVYESWKTLSSGGAIKLIIKPEDW